MHRGRRAPLGGVLTQWSRLLHLPRTVGRASRQGAGTGRSERIQMASARESQLPYLPPYSQVLILSDDGERKASALRGFSLGGEASATRSMNAEVRIFVHCKNTTPREKGDDRICPVTEPPDVSRDSHCGLGRLALAPSTLVWQAWKTAIDFRP
jgi:hypothetical protein